MSGRPACCPSCALCRQLRDVNTDQQDKGLSAMVVVDRDTASRLGISSAQVDAALYASFGQAQVSTMYRQLNQYHVVMEVDPKMQQGTDGLRDTYVRSSTGAEVRWPPSPSTCLRTPRCRSTIRDYGRP